MGVVGTSALRSDLNKFHEAGDGIQIKEAIKVTMTPATTTVCSERPVKKAMFSGLIFFNVVIA